ncbi:SH3-domain-containing protein [Sodiomyces alkalinus F11]|uniref:SH3-domain-containing protein n=1 Tax=Sodiomyces alkalinus (strain CBS 110278 / VKM F-3762 / F11) TaxID=1314773 RepID=A0A3N2PJS1_SODAK|nr:SH3-domain-containing protein [Sodiomyces alkalinus F11]ROT34759.1 SH3-domain-containing protein [Sodiomyces alkalinus F11]
MAPDRQTIMETNRSLRTIKNELENLLEKGIIDDDTYENIHSLLPAEAPLRGGGARATPLQPSNATSPPPPTEAMANMNLKTDKAHDDSNARNTGSSHSPAPPPYSQNRAAAVAPPPPPSKPVLTYARGLYRYNPADGRDLSFDRDDKIAVHQYMNADWWMGRNLRTGQEGIFPKNYVAVDSHQPPPPQPPPQQRAGPAPVQQLWPPPGPQPGYGQPGFPPPHQPQAHYAGPPPQQNPYQAAAPPMAVAHGPPEQHGADGNKVKDGVTHVGKRLGEAAVFGAGATIGANVVNSIF